jgi:hypothetical protein
MKTSRYCARRSGRRCCWGECEGLLRRRCGRGSDSLLLNGWGDQRLREPYSIRSGARSTRLRVPHRHRFRYPRVRHRVHHQVVMHRVPDESDMFSRTSVSSFRCHSRIADATLRGKRRCATRRRSARDPLSRGREKAGIVACRHPWVDALSYRGLRALALLARVDGFGSRPRAAHVNGEAGDRCHERRGAEPDS